MKVTGKIKNVVDFGAFVDIGLHETGLIHVSELSDTFVKDPMDVIKVGDVKEFTILALDKDRRRISLSLKSDAMSRLGASVSKDAKTGGEEKRRVVIVRKDAKAAAESGRQNAGQRKESTPLNGRKGGTRSSGSDDGMTYNPFAALLKK